MKLSIIGWLLFAIGVIAAVAELVLAFFVSGSAITEGVVYQDGLTVPEIHAVVRPEDKPVRIILKATGVRRGTGVSDSANSVAMTLHFGDAREPVEHVFRPRSKANSSQPNYFNSYIPLAMDDRPAGNWHLSLAVKPGANVALEKVTLQIRANNRSPNRTWILIACSLAALGFATGLIGRRRES